MRGSKIQNGVPVAIFSCENCGFEKSVPDSLSGRKAKCPQCSTVVSIVSEKEMDFSDDADSVTEPEAVMQESSKESEAIPEAVDVICDKCGTPHNPQDEFAAVCKKCGHKLPSPKEEPGVEDVDLDDFVSDRQEPVNIWDDEFSEESNREGLEASVEASLRQKRPSFISGGFFQNLYAGIVTGLLSFFFAIAYARLVVAQSGLDTMYPHLAAMALLSSAVIGIIVALRSRIPFAVGATDAVLATLLFFFVGSVFSSLVGAYGPEYVTPTIITAIALAAFLTGAGLWVLGMVRAGKWVRYIPVQIIGGVFAGIGIYMLLAVWGMMADGVSFSINKFIAVQYLYDFSRHPIPVTRWLPSVAFGIFLYAGLYKSRHCLIMLALLVCGVGLGHASALYPEGVSLSFLHTTLSIPSLTGVNFYSSVIAPGFMDHIQWQVIAEHNLFIGAMIVMTMLRVMYRSTRLEAEVGVAADLDNEYRAIGAGGILVSLIGGMPAAISYNRTLGNYNAGARGAFSALLTALICAVSFIYIEYIVPMVPVFVLEGLLIYIGLSQIIGWLFKTRTAFTRREDKRLLIITFLLTTFCGLLVGIGFGVGMAMMLGVSRYSKSGSIKNQLSGGAYRSNVDRAPAQLRVLKEFGDHIHILRLQGFVFMGTMYDLIQRIRNRIEDPEKLPLEYVILDFKLVTGFASATNIGFTLLRDLALEREVNIIFTNSPLELEEHLERSGYALNDMEGSFKMFMNLDYALEWCENQILEGENLLDIKQQTLPELLQPVFPEPRYIPALMKVLKRMTVGKGEVVIRQGDSSDTMYFVESGSFNVELSMDDGRIVRLKKVGPGAVFGEMGIYTQAPRSATVRAAEKSVVYRMTREKLELIEKRAPVLVTVINRFLINLLAERFAESNKRVHDLM